METGDWTEIIIDASLSITFTTLSQKPNENRDGK